MEPITRLDTNQTYDTAGNLIREEVVEVDITEEAVTYDLHAKVRNALAANTQMIVDAQTFLDLASPTQAQTLAAVKRLAENAQTTAKELTAIIRLLVGADLLRDIAGTT